MGSPESGDADGTSAALPKRKGGRAIRMTPTRLQTRQCSEAFRHKRAQKHIRPAATCFHENRSPRNMAPVKVVKIGARKVSTVASARERYWSE